ncbi:hypothetical protein VTG60DRAFT_6071 [Thermothelomyces hinnuleus]
MSGSPSMLSGLSSIDTRRPYSHGSYGMDLDRFGDASSVPCPAGYDTSPNRYPSSLESGQPLSPWSTVLPISIADVPSSPGDDIYSQAPTPVGSGAENQFRSKKSPSPTQIQPEAKNEEPYAQLIYRAFLSTPRRAMTLQEMYQWFRENTDKGKRDHNGWQSSIRHNLSANNAFTKRETKRSAEWYLEPWALNGVQSTSRYLKDNRSRRSAASHGGLTRHQRKGGRILRGTRQAIRGSTTNAANAAATHSQLQQHHLMPHHITARSPFLHFINNEPSSVPIPYSSVPPTSPSYTTA